MLMLVLLTGALAIEPFLFAAVLLELAAMAAILILVPPGATARPRVLQLLVLYTLAMIAILFTGWQLENVGVTSVTPELATRVMLLLGFGFSILMLVPPFHFWLPSAAVEVNPLSLTFVAMVLQASGFSLLLRFLDSFTWLRSDPRVLSAIGVAGILMLTLGSLAAVAQASFKKMAAYGLLADFGAPLVAAASGLAIGFRIGLLITALRVVGLALWSVGVAILDRESGGIDRPGAGRAAPLAAAASLIGVLSLAGFPMTAGFPGRWPLLGGLMGSGPYWVILSSGLVLVATLRWSIRWFSPEDAAVRGRVSLAERIAVWAVLGAGVVVGAFPQLLSAWVEPAIAYLTP